MTGEPASDPVPQPQRGAGTPIERSSTARWGTLEPWLTAHVERYDGPADITRYEGGQSNPTYRLNAPSGTYVLRRKPFGPLLPSAHAVDREYRVLEALAGGPVPVPRLHGLCMDEAVLGAAFYVMDCVDGRLFFDQRLPTLTRGERGAIYDSMNQTIADLHGLDPTSVGLADYGRPDNFLQRQIARWTRQYRASQTHDIPAMDLLIEWLPRRAPDRTGSGIVHGDYRLDNLIIHPTEPRVAAVLDWELSTLGDPLADFAYHVMAWRISPDVFRGLGGVDLAPLGIPDEPAYVARYRDRTGRDTPSWEFYIVHSMFRIAAIIQGIAKRAQDGTASSDQAARIGNATRPIADQAWDLARSIGP